MKLAEALDRPAAGPVPERSARSRRTAWLFPGEGRVWLVAAVVGGVLFAIMLVALLVPRDFFTGTDGTRATDHSAVFGTGSTLCVPNVEVPPGTGRIEVSAAGVGNAPRGGMTGTLYTAGGRAIPTGSVPQGPPGNAGEKVDFTIPRLPSLIRGGVFCVHGSGLVGLGEQPGFQGNDFAPVIDGKLFPGRIAMWFRPPLGEKRSYLSLLPTLLRRAALFRPGVVGAWTYWILLLAVLPAAAYAALRLLATAGGPRRRVPVALALAVLAFVNAGAWALITPAFDAPDESEHYAYAQYLAETGHAVGQTGYYYSTDENLALEATRVLTTHGNGDGKTLWEKSDETAWKLRTEGRHGDRTDGGLADNATGPHTPLYYGLLAPAYWASAHWSVFSQLTALRLMSALLGAIAAACAYGIVREILPRRPLLAVAAGVLVAFQPMYTFMSGSVNNDVGVNAAAAVLLYLVIRGLRRGLTWPLAAGIGAMAAITPLMKGTGIELYPAVAVGLLGMLWRWRGRRAALLAAGAVVAAVVVFFAWGELSHVFHRATVPVSTGPGQPGAGSRAFHHPFGYLEYLWQVFLPKLWFMPDLWLQRWPAFDIYSVRGWASFGWYAMTFAHWVYWAITLAMLAVGGLGVVTLWRNRAGAVRRLGFEIAVLSLAAAGVVAGVHAFYYTGHNHAGVIAEMGRYTFPAITALAAMAVGACLFAGRRFVLPMATTLAVAVIALCYSGQLMAIGRFFGLT